MWGTALYQIISTEYKSVGMQQIVGLGGAHPVFITREACAHRAARFVYSCPQEDWLFYVALTRARTRVTLFTVARQESPFLLELVEKHQLAIHRQGGSISENEICPS